MPTGTQLRLARIARGWTLAETARRAGLGMSTLSRLENERVRLTPDMEARLMEVLGWNAAFERLFQDLATEEQRQEGAELEKEKVGQETGQQAPGDVARHGQ